MHNHTGCTFLHCAFSSVPSNGLPERMHSHTDCICLTIFHCVFSNESSKRLHERNQSHIGCICLTLFHCAFLNVPSKNLDQYMHSHTGCICLTFLHCVFLNVLPKDSCPCLRKGAKCERCGIGHCPEEEPGNVRLSGMEETRVGCEAAGFVFL